MTATERTVKFVHDFYGLVDAGKTDEYMEVFAEDARVIFGNNPPARGPPGHPWRRVTDALERHEHKA